MFFKFLLPIVVISLLFVSCDFSDTCNRIDLSDDDLSWSKIYNEGDKVIFKSNLNRIDSMKVVENLVTYTVCNKVSVGPNQYQRSYTYLKSKLIDNGTYSDFIMLFSMNMGSDTSRKAISCFDLDYQGNLEYDNSLKLEKYYSEGLNDWIEVYSFTTKNSKSLYPNLIKSFRLSPEYGLIEFTLNSNEVFFLEEIKK